MFPNITYYKHLDNPDLCDDVVHISALINVSTLTTADVESLYTKLRSELPKTVELHISVDLDDTEDFSVHKLCIYVYRPDSPWYNDYRIFLNDFVGLVHISMLREHDHGVSNIKVNKVDYDYNNSGN